MSKCTPSTMIIKKRKIKKKKIQNCVLCENGNKKETGIYAFREKKLCRKEKTSIAFIEKTCLQ
jgi:hypothetical protein